MKLGLQIMLGVLSLIPVLFAALGVLQGAGYHMPDGGYVAALDNQYRYTSGTYILVSLMLWYCIPSIEKHFKLLAMVCAALVLGGLGRLVSHLTVGPGSDEQFAGMILELGSPLFLVWQMAVARKANAA
ncbi:MAG: DUF4345 domain-containing protein [Henriciella sp.]|nr:DUF4345 domain-containing protein [Henriciella sp.]